MLKLPPASQPFYMILGTTSNRVTGTALVTRKVGLLGALPVILHALAFLSLEILNSLHLLMFRQETLYCPLCPFESAAELCLVQHVEDSHHEDSTMSATSDVSPPMGPQESPVPSEGKSDGADYIECFCNEFCLLNGQQSQLICTTSFWRQLTYLPSPLKILTVI